MSEPSIQVEDLGKVYPVPATPGGWIARLAGTQPCPEPRWALRGVGFTVMPGESLGILGHNGAGKSTLLKILARVTRPTTGRFQLRGRLAALLELQAGFNPEWTGRENVYGKGATMRAGRAEIRRRFDEIVAFAELEDSIDLPIRSYSSGMRTRLALSTVLHLESDILIVDEALAGGDHHFQLRCRRRLADIRDRGTALLLVSHRASTVAACCQRAITLDGGVVVAEGTVEEALNAYHLRRPDPSSARGRGRRGLAATEPLTPHRTAPRADGSAAVRIGGLRVCGEDGRTAAVAGVGSTVGIEITYDVPVGGAEVVAALWFQDDTGSCTFFVAEDGAEWRGRTRPAGTYRSTAWLPPHLLAPGRLRVGVRLWARPAGAGAESGSVAELHPAEGVGFEVLEGLASAGGFPEPLSGVVRPSVPWTTRFQPPETGAATPGERPSPGGRAAAYPGRE
ncbi:MAG TPA: ABC transporter ATP-binding protein [Longimicrobium sp.]